MVIVVFEACVGEVLVIVVVLLHVDPELLMEVLVVMPVDGV